MRQRCAAFLDPEFARRKVAAAAGESGAVECAAEIVRVHGTRVTLRYSFSSGTTVYGKTHHGGTGRRRFETLRALWRAGFDGTGGTLIPEPLAFLDGEEMVLMREARGVPLARLSEQPLDTAEATVRAAARWLAQLHSAAVPDLEEETPCTRLRILEESDLLIEAAAACPASAAVLAEFVASLRELAGKLAPQRPLAPAHGQFIPSAIFFDRGTVTVIDLDTLRLSDPAIDVASFVSRVKYRKLFNGRAEPARAAMLASAFIQEYERAGRGSAASLSYHLALYCLREFAKSVMEPGADSGAGKRAEEWCRGELRSLAAGRAPPTHSGRRRTRFRLTRKGES